VTFPNELWYVPPPTTGVPSTQPSFRSSVSPCQESYTIDRVPLEPGGDGPRQAVAGKPFDEQVIGPSNAAWGRGPGDYGRVAYVTTDGGLIAPPSDGIVRPAKLLRVELSGAASRT
jgi:hypothetical protein